MHTSLHDLVLRLFRFTLVLLGIASEFLFLGLGGIVHFIILGVVEGSISLRRRAKESGHGGIESVEGLNDCPKQLITSIFNVDNSTEDIDVQKERQRIDYGEANGAMQVRALTKVDSCVSLVASLFIHVTIRCSKLLIIKPLLPSTI